MKPIWTALAALQPASPPALITDRPIRRRPEPRIGARVPMARRRERR